MKSLKVFCPNCIQKIEIEGVDSNQTLKIECPSCQEKFFTEKEEVVSRSAAKKVLRPSGKNKRPQEKAKKRSFRLVIIWLFLLSFGGGLMFVLLNNSVGFNKGAVLASSADSSLENESRAENRLSRYRYYPVFASDTMNEEIPFSLYQGARLSKKQMQKQKEAAQKASSTLRILEQVQAPFTTIIPLQSQVGRYLHLKLLDNTNTDKKLKNYCHVSGIFFASSEGQVYSRKNYALVNDGDIKHHYPTDPPKHILEGRGEHRKVWHSALDRNFPYSFSIDCQQSQEISYLVFTHRAPRANSSFIKNFLVQISDKASAEENKMAKRSTEGFLTDLARERSLMGINKIALADAASNISLRHYNARRGNKSLSWSLWAELGVEYVALVRMKDSSKKIDAKFIFAEQRGDVKSSRFSSNLRVRKSSMQQLKLEFLHSVDVDKVLSVELLSRRNLAAFVEQKVDAKHIYQADYSEMNREIVQKMEKLAAGHYDIRTTVSEKMKSGQNAYLIITSEEKRKALASLDAFIRHKRSRGFEVTVITEKDYGGGKGVKAALNIRKWLRANYKSKNLLYVLMLGNPHPREGDVPYKKVQINHRLVQTMKDLGMNPKDNPDFEEADGYCPTDYFYADLSGNWDKNDNGIYADDGDYGVGGVDGQPEVYVGRIPYYGINSSEGNAREVDLMLERVIRYENEAGDLSWRHNIFYSGDTFNRTQVFYNEYLAHNGADFVRHTHDDSLFFGQQRHDQRQDFAIETQNDGKFGFVYYQEHASPWSIGMMSSNGALQLEDDYPSVFALGGCDVASPEHSNNICFALLRHGGIAVYGGTRSVTGCNNNRWHKHDSYYPRLHFGMSSGETLWTMRANQSKGKKIAATNFLINLLGDPSVVVMPQVRGEELSISPGFEVKISCVQGVESVPKIAYEIQNNSSQSKKYRLALAPGLSCSEREFSLPPRQIKKIHMSISKPASYASGNHDFSFELSSGRQKKLVEIQLEVKAKALVYHNDFDSPIAYLGDQRKHLKVEARKSLSKGVRSAAAVFGAHAAEINTPSWADRDSYTLSLFQNVRKAGNYDILTTGNISIFLHQGRVKVWHRPGGWVYGQRAATRQFEGPKYSVGKWQQIAVTYDRSTQQMKIYVDEQVQRHKLDYSSNVRFPAKQLRFRQGGHIDYAVDELSIFNYPLEKNELQALGRGQFARPMLPLDGNKIHPQRVVLSWHNKSRKNVQLQVASDLEFKNIVFASQALSEMKVSGLKEGQRYFWRVNYPVNKGFQQSSLVRSFFTDDTAEPILFSFRPIKLPSAKVGRSGYDQQLIHFVEQVSAEEKRKLVFTKLSGPSWLRIYSDGKLFTNYGPQLADKGENVFRFRVSASDGSSKIIEFIVDVAL